VIFLDSNVFVIDLRYRDDPLYAENSRFLDAVRRRGIGVTGLINVLETCGILSFNLSAQQLVELFVHFAGRYGVLVVPGCGWDTSVPDASVRELLEKMQLRMCLKDAEIALQAQGIQPPVEAFVTWNARHFEGRLPFSVLTPREWSRRRASRRRR
jgi:hypothetical protein